MAAWVPTRDDVVWFRFSPQAGHEQAGRRPALVLSPAQFNRRAGLMLCCPIKSKVKGYPFEILLPEGLAVEGAILTDQVRSLDWKAWSAKLIGRVENSLIRAVIDRILPLLLE